ncbi:MAG: NADH-quinone oxidoreductase subunit H [Deltaproteobacteria bacterium]|nr:NADH-quinone oxidoreductase subunit H [Deltaproteobacteria bacterium]
MESDPILWVVHVALLLAAPPFFLGVIAKTKAWFAGRKGPPLFQLYYDLYKLFQRGTVTSKTATFVFRAAPAVIFILLVAAGLLIPIGGAAPIHFQGDIILFAYLLGMARFLMILSAMDTGSSFEGMGASREAAFGALSELAFFLILVVLAVMTRTLSLNGIFQWESFHSTFQPVFLLLLFSFFLILLTENSRMPIDDPATHLELTMIHEVMILDTSGPDLGLILYGASIKLFIFMTFAVSLLWPETRSWDWTAFASFLVKIGGMAVAIGVVEAANARLRLLKIPQFLIANFVVTVFALLVAVFGRGT